MCHDGERTKILEPWIRHIFSRKFALGLHLLILCYACPLADSSWKMRSKIYVPQGQNPNMRTFASKSSSWKIAMPSLTGMSLSQHGMGMVFSQPHGCEKLKDLRVQELGCWNCSTLDWGWFRWQRSPSFKAILWMQMALEIMPQHPLWHARVRSCLQAFKPTNDPEPKLLDSLKRCDSSPGKASVYTCTEVTWWKLCATQRQRSQITWEWWQKRVDPLLVAFCYISCHWKHFLFPRSI